MAKKPEIDAHALDVIAVTVAADGSTGASISFAMAAEANLKLHLPPETLAKLEAMLIQASVEQAKHQPVQ